MTPAFRRNARDFANYLSSLLTRTVTRQPLACDFIAGRDQALIRFRSRYAHLANNCTIRILQRIGHSPQQRNKVTTLEYSYAFIVGLDPDVEPFFRYEYVPELAATADYSYPVGHLHVHASVPDYDALIGSREKPFHHVHFPTGRIALEAFIKLLIVELNVPTHTSRENVLAFLNESHRIFLKQKKTKD